MRYLEPWWRNPTNHQALPTGLSGDRVFAEMAVTVARMMCPHLAV